MTGEPAACTLYVGTEDGVRTIRYVDGEFEVIHAKLQGNAVRALAVDPRNPDRLYVGCGLRGWGLHRTTDGGGQFESLGFEDEWVWGVTVAPDDPDYLYVGIEPPMLYAVTEGDRTAFEGIDDVPSRSDWTFFHAPFYAGHIHGIAVHPDYPQRIFAGVEHGALIYTYDGGKTWHDALVGFDVHRIAIDPADPDRVLAATGSGLQVSEDAAKSWETNPDLDGKYVHGITFHPTTEILYAYADHVDCPVYRSDDRGENWQAVGRGLRPARPADNVALHPTDPEVVFYIGDRGVRRSQLYVSTDGGDEWTTTDLRLPKTWRATAAGPG